MGAGGIRAAARLENRRLKLVIVMTGFAPPAPPTPRLRVTGATGPGALKSDAVMDGDRALPATATRLRRARVAMTPASPQMENGRYDRRPNCR